MNFLKSIEKEEIMETREKNILIKNMQKDKIISKDKNYIKLQIPMTKRIIKK